MVGLWGRVFGGWANVVEGLVRLVDEVRCFVVLLCCRGRAVGGNAHTNTYTHTHTTVRRTWALHLPV